VSVAAERVLRQFTGAHEALLTAGLAWTHNDPASAADALQDVSIVALDLAADLRRLSEPTPRPSGQLAELPGETFEDIFR
jgi:hypothetical protein